MEEGGPRFIVQGLSALDEAVLRAQQGEIHIYVDNDSGLGQLKGIIDTARSRTRNSGVQIRFFVDWGKAERVVVALPDQYQLSPSTMANIESIEGIARVVEV